MMIYTVENTAAIGRRVKVFVNGKEANRVILADTKKGFVEYYPINPKTNSVRLNRKKDKLVTKRRRGRVSVEFI